jgi:hypothetical protein
MPIYLHLLALSPLLLFLGLILEDAAARDLDMAKTRKPQPPAAPAQPAPRASRPPAQAPIVAKPAPERPAVQAAHAPESPRLPLLANAMANAERQKPKTVSSTYMYRDPAKRRAYMAEYMRAYRAQKAQERRQARGSAAASRPAEAL